LWEDIIEVGFKKPGFDRNIWYIKINHYHFLPRFNIISECCAEIEYEDHNQPVYKLLNVVY
jgi:hypothetical protein